MSRRKYEPGRRFRSVDQLAKTQVVYCTTWNRAVSTAWFMSWPFRSVLIWTAMGRIVRAIKKEGK